MQNHIQNESEFKKIYSILSLYVFLNWPRNFFFFRPNKQHISMVEKQDSQSY